MIDYYTKGQQKNRLKSGLFRLEYARTIEIIERYIDSEPAVMYDIGSGAGNYASYFAKKNHIVSVVDLFSIHIKQAKELSNTHPKTPIKSFHVGDARELPFDNNIADIVFLSGPLYHLLNRGERIAALKEAKRVLKPNGRLVASYVSRLATTFLEGIGMNLFKNSDFVEKSKEMAKTGLIKGNDFFTDAYCHKPDEIKPEIEESGLFFEKIIPVEGIGCVLKDFDDWWDNRNQELLELVKEHESNSSIIGLSSHLLSISKKNN